MALSLGKLTILVGAGILGSVLAKEGRVSDFVSGAFKIALKQIKQDDSSPSVKKPRNDLLMAQVNSLRQELQILASNRSVTIVTASRTGASKYGVVIVIVVLGYGYIWWKGWRLPDMMFATRRSLSDARTSISKKLENVYSSISATERTISSRIEGLNHGLDECLETTSRTQAEVSEVRGRIDLVGEDVRSVYDAVQTLETKIIRIEGKQAFTVQGVRMLCDVAKNLENGSNKEGIQAIPSSSSRALDPPPSSPLRTGPLPPALMSEPMSSPDSSGSNQEANGISEAIGASSGRGVANGISGSEDSNNGASTSRRFGLRLPSINASFITRTRSATNAMLQHTRSTAT